MASREESVDVSITAALAKIAQIEKALAKATKATVTLNTTSAMQKVKVLDQAITKATARRSFNFDTARAQAQIRALGREVDKAVTGKAAGGVDLGTVSRGRAAQQSAQAQAVRGAEEAAAKEAAAVEKSAAAQVRAEQKKAAEIQGINARLAAMQQKQVADAERTASAASNRALANQRASLSAQLSQTRSLQNIGQTITFGLTLPIAGAAVAVSRLGFQFEDTMNRIRILTTPALRTSQKAIDDLRATILSLGAQTGQGPAQLAEGFYQIASAGVSGAVALDVLKASAQAATIGLGDVNVVADISTSVLNAYGASAGNAFQITNTLAEAVRIAKGEASEFAPVLGRLLPVAKNLGISFSDVAGSVALLTRNGLSASEATTQLRGLFNSFIKPSVQARKELDRVGLSSTQLLAQLQAGDFIGAINRIKVAFGGDQLGLGRLFRNQQGLNAFLTLSRDINATADALNQVKTAGEGATREVSGFEQIKADPVVQFKIALAQVQAELIKIGTAIAPAVVAVAKLAAGFLALFNALPTGVKFVVAAALGVAALAGPFLIAFTAVQRLRIAKQQLDLAMGNNTGMDAAGASAGRFGQLVGGQAGGIIKFTSALVGLAAIAGSFSLGQQLATAADGGERLQSVLSIAGTTLTAFVAGSAVGGPVVGGLAAAGSLAAAAIGDMSKASQESKKPLNDLKESLVGVTDAAKQAAIIVPTLRALLENTGGANKFSTLTLPDFEKANVNVKDFSTAIVKGGAALDTFNKAAGSKIATTQLQALQAEIGKGPKLADDFSNKARGLLVELNKFKLIKFSDSGQVLGITDTAKALLVLGGAAEKNLGGLAGKIQGPISEAAALSKILTDGASSAETFGAAVDDAGQPLQGFGSTADGAAISISDLASALDDAVKAANDLNNAKLDKFTGQADTAAALADLFDTIQTNKDVLPHLGEQFDLTTEAGRKQAKQAAEVVDGISGIIKQHQEEATQIVATTGDVTKGTEAYGAFLTQLAGLAPAAGISADQLNLILAASGGDLAGFVDSLRATGVEGAAAAKGAIDALLGAIPADAAAAVQSIKEPSDQVAALAAQLSLLDTPTLVNVIASVANADTVDTLAEVIQNFDPTTQVAILAQTLGLPGVEELNAQILDATSDDQIATVIAETKDPQKMQALLDLVTNLSQPRIASILAKVEGKQEVDNLKTKVDGTNSKNVTVGAKVTGKTEVDALDIAITRLKDKSVTVTTRFNNIQQGAGLRIIGRNPDGTPIFGRSGMHFGPGGVRKMASGGVITGMARQPMIVRQRSARGILWGEPETMGEAYISYARRFRDRNRHILARVASDFGMMVVPRRAASGMVIERRAAGGISDQQLSQLANAVTARRPERTAPIIDHVTVEVASQTPAAFAVEAVGALGARLADRLADRG